MILKVVKFFAKSKRFMCKVGNLDVDWYKTPKKLQDKKMPWPIYGGRQIVSLLPGSGIGPELLNCIQDVFKTAHVPVDFEVIDTDKDTSVKEAATSIQRNRVGIKGNIRFSQQENSDSPNVYLRNKLDLYVYVVHYKTIPKLKLKHSDVDILLIKQNTEGEYAMLEHETVKGYVESMKIITSHNTRRLGRWALEFAHKNQRKKITVVQKSELLLSDALFLETIKDVAKNYPNIELEDIDVAYCCYLLVQKPQCFDVLIMPNLYGTIFTNVLSGLLGGPGMHSGINFGDDLAIFELATRLTQEDIAGKNVANPIGMLRCSIDLLNYINKKNHAKLIENAVLQTIAEENIRTIDLGGKNSTSDVVENIKMHIRQNISNYKLF